MIFLIPSSIILLTLILYLLIFGKTPQTVRRSLTSSIILLFIFVAISTEALSSSSAITERNIQGIWVVLNIILLVWFWSLKSKYHKRLLDIYKGFLQSAISFTVQLGRLTQIVLTSLLLITFLVAVISPPNNLDSLSYHVSRLGYWIQNGTVEHYASHIERSISFSPFSEYVHLHVYLLTGSDRFLQLLQWVSMLGILIYVSLILELLEAKSSAISFSLSFTITIPIVVLESMTTQNDLVVAFFVIATIFYVFDFIKSKKKLTLLFLAASISLGILTKGTFIFFTTPFGIYLVIHLIKNSDYKSLILTGTLVIALTLMCNLPFWLRTYNLFNSPIGNMNHGNRNVYHSPAAITSSISKHLFLHLGFVSPGNKYNEFMERQLENFHQFLGIPLNDPGMGMRFKMNKLNFNEDFAHNFLAIWLIIFSLLIASLKRPGKLVSSYFWLSLSSFLLFCTFISYQVYGSRLHIPFFISIAPAIGIIYGNLSTNFQKPLIIILWINALPFALLSSAHPLLSTSWFFSDIFPTVNKVIGMKIQPDKQANLMRESILFTPQENIIWGEQWPEIQTIVANVNSLNAKKIGFYFGEGSFDYGYQFVLRRLDRKFEHIMVQNPSKKLEKGNFKPDCVISEIDLGYEFKYKGVTYLKNWKGTQRYVYVPLVPFNSK